MVFKNPRLEINCARMISSPGILRPQRVRIYWSRRQAQTRRNIFRRRPAEEAVAVVGVAGVVVGEDGEKEGMGKWMLTRVRKAAVGPPCGLFALFKAFPLLQPSQLTPLLLTSILVVHFLFGLCTHFTLPVLVLLCISITDLSSEKNNFF